MIYLRWDKNKATGLDKFGLAYVVTECAEDGSVLREIGFDELGKPVHRAPDSTAKFFLFDLQVVALSVNPTTCMSATEFLEAWQRVGVPPNNWFKSMPLRGTV